MLSLNMTPSICPTYLPRLICSLGDSGAVDAVIKGNIGNLRGFLTFLGQLALFDCETHLLIRGVEAVLERK